MKIKILYLKVIKVAQSKILKTLIQFYELGFYLYLHIIKEER